MNDEWFDDVARGVASGISRRKLLKMLLIGTAGGLLARAGFRGNAYVLAVEPPPVYPYKTFLPYISRACLTASACGSRQYCSPDQSCICVRSAEGDIRCGKLPSTCDVPLCQTSADCAHLGEGYFCDTPNSGCCADGELPRCIGPCQAPACPPERTCGSNCCPVGELCVGGACCPADRACGSVCCSSLQECMGGTCTTTCGGDPVTKASIDAARAALEGGADNLFLSPNGCLRYSRVVSGGFVTHEEMLIYYTPVMVWDHTPAQSIGQEDGDLDGFFERRIEATRGATVNDDRLVISSYSPSTQALAARITSTRTADVIHVLEEQANASGTLVPVAKYDRGLWVDTLAPQSPHTTARTSADVQAAPCSPLDCSQDTLRKKFDDAVNQGLQCLHRNKAYDLEHRLTSALFRDPVNLACESIPPRPEGKVLARTSQAWPYPLDLFPHATIAVNQDEFCGLGATEQLAVLFHESMHLENPNHDPNKETASDRDQVDQFYACQKFCFNPPQSVTQCSCATCLETSKCDARCDTALGFQTCSDDFGAWCPCPTRLRWYRSCTECLTECPSGLGCSFFSSCLPVNKGRCTPTTCP